MPLDSPTRILAVRHGETLWNRSSRIQGHTDIELSPLGMLQAQRLAQALREEAIDAVYASDLLRASQTAEAVVRLRPELQRVRQEVGLRERAFGVFEGLTWQQIAEQSPEQSERWRRRDADFCPEGGESLAHFDSRCRATFQRLAETHRGQSLLIVCHGGVLDCVYRAATGQSLQAPRSWDLGNASINRLLYAAGGFRLLAWNDHAHLEGLA